MKSVRKTETCHLLAGKRFKFDKARPAHTYIEKIAVNFPARIAVKFGQERITYQSLNEKANQLAHYLISNQGIAPGDLVGIYFTPSIYLIIAILAIIKTGAAYVPLDLSYPEKHISLIIENANPKLILTNLTVELVSKSLNVNDIAIDSLPVDNPNLLISPESCLYIIYTSGTTGKPKGVAIPHRAAINHMTWMLKEFNFTKKDKVLLKTPLTFDPSVWEIFLPLFAGAELIIAPVGSHIDTYQLFNTIVEHEVTTIQFVPAILDKFLQHKDIFKCSSLKRVFVGGESLQSKTKQKFFKKIKCPLINLYGPTETCIDITYHIVSNTEEDIARDYIGKPINNTHLYILNDNMSICNPEEEGELYISGESVGLGYYNDEKLTEQSFIPNLVQENEILYKTGDIVKCTTEGIIEYLYRKDKQIKINGVRVELTALINKVFELETVADCHIVKSNLKNEERFSYLICYLVPKKDCLIDITAVKNLLSSFFPKNILPKEYFILDKLPLLPNGKINLKKLELQGEAAKNEQLYCLGSKQGIGNTLKSIMSNTLNANILSDDQDIYDYGFDSLSCLMLIEEIENKLHIDLQVHEILANKSIDSLSDLILKKIKHVQTDTTSNNNTIIALKPSGQKTPVFLIHPIGGTVFWFNNLSKYFDPDRPLYGIQDPGIESEEYIFESIEEMAKYYLTHIKLVQPEGPYIIGGASFGATVAVEISRHLDKRETVTIPILDGWAVYPHELQDEDYFRRSMLRQQADWKRKFGVYCIKEYKKIFNIQKHRLEMLYEYRMQPIHHDLILFKANEIMDLFKSIDCEDNNWSKYTTGKLEVINVAGNHETMFQCPHAKSLGRSLSLLLNSREDL